MKAVAGNAPCKISKLDRSHKTAGFYCHHDALNLYLQKQASQDMKRRIAVTYVLTFENEQSVLGYYSLASTSINLGELPCELTKKLPRYPLVPAILLGRLAVDPRHEGNGFGSYLLIDALRRSLDSSADIGAAAIFVNAKDKNAADFYKHFSFIELEHHKLKLFLPMNEVKNLFLSV